MGNRHWRIYIEDRNDVKDKLKNQLDLKHPALRFFQGSFPFEHSVLKITNPMNYKRNVAIKRKKNTVYRTRTGKYAFKMC